MNRPVVGLTAAAASAVLLSACTGGGGDPSPSGSADTSPGSSPATSSPTADVPQDMLTYQLKPAATATSTTFLGNGKPATLSVASVRATATGTVLTFWLTADPGYTSPLAINKGVEAWPQLVDAAGGSVYRIDTFPRRTDKVPQCICTDNNSVDPQRRVLTGAYPLLPTGVTQIAVRLKGFKDLTVPVTR